MTSLWKTSIDQTRKGDPRIFISSKTTQDALWASKDSYLRNNKSKREGLIQVASYTIEPTNAVSSSLNKLFGQNGVQLCVYKDLNNTLNNNIIVAFEGTNSFSSIWKDVQLFQSTKPSITKAKGKVHSGFNTIYEQSKPFLEEIFDNYPQANVTFTGHSLGGALASLALADDWKVSTSKAITFGAPQVGDVEFQKWFSSSNKRLDRVIQKTDPIVSGNLNYVHMDNSAWTIGSGDWINLSSHSISSYEESFKRVNNDIENMNDSKYVFPMARKFINTLDTGKKISDAFAYLEAAEEMYQVTQLASGLPQTTETLKNILFTHDGVLNRSFETVIDSLGKLKTPSKQDFKNIFEQRVVELKITEKTNAPNTKLNTTLKRNVDKFLPVDTTLNRISIEDVAIQLERKPTYIEPEDYVSPPKSNYNAILKEKVNAKIGKFPILKTALTNIKEAKNWVSSTMSPLFKGASRLSSLYGASSSLQDLVTGKLSWEDSPETALQLVHGALTIHETAASLGFIEGISSGSFIAGVTAPALATVASAIGLMSFALYSVLEKQKKGLYNDLGGNGVLNSIGGVRETAQHKLSNRELVVNYLEQIKEFADKTGLTLPSTFFQDSFDRIEFKNGVIKLKDGSPIEDLLYPPILGIHANEPEKYQKYVLAKDVYTYSKDIVQNMNEEDFITTYADRISLNDQNVFIGSQPFQDVIMPKVIVDGEQVYPSKNPSLYNSALNLQQSFKELVSPNEIQKFIDENAKNTQIIGNKILINGEDARDVLFPPIQGVYFSKNVDAYQKAMLTQFLYDNLKTSNFLNQEFEDFFIKYYPTMNLDPDGNILIRDEPASSFNFEPIIDPNGQVIYKIDSPYLFDKVLSFNQHADELLKRIASVSLDTLTIEQVWNTYKDSIKVDEFGNLILGMTSLEANSYTGQLKIMDYIENFAESQDIELDNNFYKTKIRMEKSTVPLKIEIRNGEIWFKDKNWMGYFFKDISLNNKTIKFEDAPVDYMSALILKKDPELYTMSSTDIRNKLSELNKYTTVPIANLSSIAGEWTSIIGVLQGDIIESKIEKEHAMDDFRTFKRRMKMDNNEFSSLQDAVKRGDISQDNRQSAIESLYKTFVNKGQMDISFDEFSDVYLPLLSFDTQGNILVNNSRDIPPPIPIKNSEGQNFYKVQDPKEWDRLDLTNKVFGQLLDSGKVQESERMVFIDDYKDRLDIRDGSLYLDNNQIDQYTEQDTPLLNPVEDIETKLSNVSTEPIIDAMDNLEAVQIIPGSNGFVPNGEMLSTFLIQDSWNILFENKERDSIPKMRNASGFSLMGNWIGPSPYSNAPPINTLDSYFLAFHIQSKHSNTMATNFLIMRIKEALRKETINPNKDVREFEIATMVVDLPETSEVFEIMKLDDTACNTLDASIQRNWKDITNRSIFNASLPKDVDPHKLNQVPKFRNGDNIVKRTIEAAGILDDSTVQLKVRKIYSDYIGILEFSKQYMSLISQAQENKIVPDMERIELEGRIAQDQVKELISNELVKVLSMPLIEFFK